MLSKFRSPLVHISSLSSEVPQPITSTFNHTQTLTFDLKILKPYTQYWHTLSEGFVQAQTCVDSCSHSPYHSKVWSPRFLMHTNSRYCHRHKNDRHNFFICTRNFCKPKERVPVSPGTELACVRRQQVGHISSAFVPGKHQPIKSAQC